QASVPRGGATRCLGRISSPARRVVPRAERPKQPETVLSAIVVRLASFDPYSIRHLTCERRGGFVSRFFRIVAQGGGKPGAGEGPFPVGGGSGQSKGRRRFRHRKAGKDSGFDNLRGHRFGAG